MPPELARRMRDYHLQAFWVHNTYLEILVEHGVAGIVLYAWIIFELFRLGRRKRRSDCDDEDFPDGEFRKIWPVILGVYLLNAALVVMNYQFVNGLMFTLAGILAAQNARIEQGNGVLAS